MKASIALLCALLLLPASLLAENSTRQGQYTIHHNALTTDVLTPAIASQYGIERSTGRGMVNISVIREQAGTTGTPVSATVTLKARNLIGQQRDFPLREVREQAAIYYIADFLVGDRERLIFDIEVEVPGETYPLKARFEQEFFTR